MKQAGLSHATHYPVIRKAIHTGGTDGFGQHCLEARPVQMPSIAIRIQDEVAVADFWASPTRTIPQARLVFLLHEPIPNAELLEKDPRIGRDTLADAQVVGRRSPNHHHTFNTAPGQCESGGASRYATTHHCNRIGAFAHR
jgi:hypothetical protein